MTNKNDLITTYFDSAIACQRNADLQMAKSLYRKILAIQPTHEPAIGNLALVVKEMGQHNQAIQLLKKLICQELNLLT